LPKARRFVSTQICCFAGQVVAVFAFLAERLGFLAGLEW
jgi:hypothetical protein